MFLGWKLAGTRCRQEGLRAGRRSARYGEVQEHRLPLCKRASSTTRRMWWAPTALLVLQYECTRCKIEISDCTKMHFASMQPAYARKMPENMYTRFPSPSSSRDDLISLEIRR
ncbi:hypothetical protein BST61_g10232 [Cercospora zeina]